MRAGRIIGLAAALLGAGIAGAAAQTNGVTPTEVVFGTHTDLSGVAATYGISSSNGVIMKFDEVNAAGGIYGRKLVMRLPRMLGVVADQTHAGAEGRGVVVNAWLPRHAPHNLALAAEAEDMSPDDLEAAIEAELGGRFRG